MRNLLALIILIGMITLGCKGSDPVEPEVPIIPDKIVPEAALLTFPEQNAICISGTGNSVNQSTVVFKWSQAKNAEQYEISLKNLVTGSSVTQLSVTPELAIAIQRGTPYSWFVISKSKDGNTAASAVWKFYNSDSGTLSHPPFPADQMLPSFGSIVTPENGKIKLSWKGTDTDNDIVSYDIYFGTSANPELLKAAHTTENLPEVSVLTKTTYFWKVLTRDAKGNTSESETFRFTTF